MSSEALFIEGRSAGEIARSDALLHAFHHACLRISSVGAALMADSGISLSTKVRELDALREHFEELEKALDLTEV